MKSKIIYGLLLPASAFFSITLTFVCLAICIIGFRLKAFSHTALLAFSRVLLVLLFMVSLFASLWMYDMHRKKEIVGYSEWIRHLRQSSSAV